MTQDRGRRAGVVLAAVIITLVTVWPASAQESTTDQDATAGTPGPAATPTPKPVELDPAVKAVNAAREAFDVHAMKTWMTQKVDGDSAGPAQKLMTAYSRLVDHPAAVNQLVGLEFLEYRASKQQAKSAAQVSQLTDEAGLELQLIQIAQNQKIIELLRQLAKGTATPKAPASR